MYTTNYHTHTNRCKHAVGTDREYVEAAIRAGLKTLGFSDHVPYRFPDGHISPIRMPMEQVEDYITSLTALREAYKDDIDIRIGFETEYFPDLFEALLSELDSFPYDYMILGQHFLDQETTDGSYAGRGGKDSAYLSRYTDLVLAALDTGCFSCLAHPDLPRYTGDPAIFHTQALRICQRTRKLGIPLEINMQGYRENRGYPSAAFFEIAGQVGNTVIIGADAHTPDALCDTASYNDCRAFAAQFGLPVTDTLPLFRR